MLLVRDSKPDKILSTSQVKDFTVNYCLAHVGLKEYMNYLYE